MTRIGLLSDTHSYFDPKLVSILSQCDQIWHAGDIGDYRVIDQLRAIKPVIAVAGNIDDTAILKEFGTTRRFMCEEVDVLLTHIGGYPGKYHPSIKPQFKSFPPKLFICGHSHICKVQYDNKFQMLTVNPGAAGKQGWHTVQTVIRFVINGSSIEQMEVVEW